MTTEQKAARQVVSRLAQAQWEPLNPNIPDGPQIAILWGDPKSGPYGALVRVPAGYESPVHRHSNDERVVVLKGSSIHWTIDQSRETATPLRTGDCMIMPANVMHVSAACPGEEYFELVTQDGKYDFVTDK